MRSSPPGFTLLGTVRHHRLFGLMTDTMYLYGVAHDRGNASCLAAGQG